MLRLSTLIAPRLSEARRPAHHTAARLIACLLPCALILCLGCQPKTPEELVNQARGRYIVELNSWFPRVPEPPVVADPEMADGEAMEGEDLVTGEADPAADAGDTDGDTGDGDLDGDLDGETEQGPATVDIFFDLIVMFEGDDPLPGLTLDVSQAGADGTEKTAWRHYLELPSHIKGETKQVSFVASDIEFTDGDQFSVVVEQFVAPEDQAEYQEFSTAP